MQAEIVVCGVLAIRNVDVGATRGGLGLGLGSSGLPMLPIRVWCTPTTLYALHCKLDFSVWAVGADQIAWSLN